MAQHGPYLLSTVGDKIIAGLCVECVVWEGTTTAGDTVELKDPVTGLLFWRGRANDTNTYLGVAWSDGLKAPNGIVLAQKSSGTVFVYPREN